MEFMAILVFFILELNFFVKINSLYRNSKYNAINRNLKRNSRNKPSGKSWIVNEWILREQYHLYSARFWEHYSWSLVLQLWNRFIKPKPWIRKVRTSRGHLLAEKRTIHGTWYTYCFFRNKTFLFVKVEIFLKIYEL